MLPHFGIWLEAIHTPNVDSRTLQADIVGSLTLPTDSESSPTVLGTQTKLEDNLLELRMNPMAGRLCEICANKII